MSEYSYVEQPILTWLCGEPKPKYGTVGLGWTYRDEAAMAELTSAAGTQLDPTVVEALIRVIVRTGEHRA